MFPIQPTGLSYFSSRKIEVPGNLKRYFYASWEDALWDILKFQNIKPSSIALVPEFFCPDVIFNMEAHGLRCVYYPVDKNFQTDPTEFKSALEKHKPKVLVIFHAVGITNRLFEKYDVWRSALPKGCILIEDSVHRVVNPQDIILLNARHVVLDSLRKVAPVPGCNMYCDLQEFTFTPTAGSLTLVYQAQVLFWWVAFQIALSLVRILPMRNWQKFWNKLAENAMLAGYEVIGDSKQAGAGWGIARWLATHLDFEKIKKKKESQVKQYEESFVQLWQTKSIFQIKIPTEDYGRLRGYPVGLTLNFAKVLLNKLRDAGLLVRFELEGCPWSSKHKVIYLPLGPHVNEKEIDWVVKLISSAVLTSTGTPSPEAKITSRTGQPDS